jgi:hypothetical protein
MGPPRYDVAMTPVPRELRWLLWDLDAENVDVEEGAASILGRVLEHGRLSDVRLVLELYGRERVHEFFRAGDHPIVSERTRSFWHAFFGADEKWPTRPDFRKHSGAPWIG